MIRSAFFYFWVAALASLSTVASAKTPKNVVLILADDLGWADTTLFGKTSLYETPNIERLAARGMTFSNAYASPICSPTRASIMTGQNPARLGMTAPAAHLEGERFEAIARRDGPPHQKSTNVVSATRLDPEIPMLAEVLKSAGYSTAHFGKWHLGREPHSPLECGFDVDLPHWWGPGPKSGYLAPWGYTNPEFTEGQPGEHIEDRMAKEAIHWLKHRDRTQPFFLNYWQFSVHAPFGAKPDLIDRYRKKLGDSVAGLSDAKVRDRYLTSHPPGTGLAQQSPTYAAMVHSLDDAVGSLLDALDAEGIADETVIIFYSDNGGNLHCGLEETDVAGKQYITPITSNHPLRGGKGGIHEGGVRVPAVVVWPGVTQPGSRSDVRIQSPDLYPTLLQILNLDQPKNHVLDGVNIVPALRGEAMDRGPMFTHAPGHGGTPHWLPPSMSVHDGDWKLIRTFHYGEDGQHQYRLYNLRDDIGEANNLAATYPEKVRQLDTLIEEFIKEANVVVPLPNPDFDPSTFDPEKIGVQPGGLKMPPGFKKQDDPPETPQPKKIISTESMLGWISRSGEISLTENALKIRPTGRQTFIANAKVRASGDVKLKLRIRAEKGGQGQVQWRLEGQESFPKGEQTQAFRVKGGAWEEVSVSIPAKERLIHLRIFPTAAGQTTEIDWIELNSSKEKERKRWDFKSPPAVRSSEVRCKSPSPEPPNIILILADDLGYDDLGFQGSKDIQSPHLDKLAEGSIRFTDAHTTASVCSPSRAGLMTGRYQQRFGHEANTPDYPNGMDIDETTLAQRLQSLGYRTGLIGKWHLGAADKQYPTQRGFDSFYGLREGSRSYFYDAQKNDKPGDHRAIEYQGEQVEFDGYLTDVFGEQAVEFIKSSTDEPFFLYLSFTAPHGPMHATEKDLERFKHIENPRRRTYAAMIWAMDRAIGKVIAELEQRGQLDNTLIWFLSDNGGATNNASSNVPLAGHKGLKFEGGIRVPFLMSWKARFPEGQVDDRMISALDIFPTSVAAAGGVPSDNPSSRPLDGVNLLPYLTGSQEGVPHDKLYWHKLWFSAMRDGPWKLIYVQDYGYALYNLEEDLGEKHNLFGQEPTRAKAMQEDLLDWKNQMIEPLWGENERWFRIHSQNHIRIIEAKN